MGDDLSRSSYGDDVALMAWNLHAIEQTHSLGQDVASMAWWRLKFDSYTVADVRDEHPQRLLGGDAARRLAQRGATEYYERRGQSSHHSWPSLPHRIMT